MSSLNGARLAISALLVVALTWTIYKSRSELPSTTPVMYRGAMAGAAILAVLALFHSPGVGGGLVAVGSLAAAGAFIATQTGRE